MGRRHAAEPYWQMLSDEGDEDATFALAKIRLASNDLDGAIDLFRKAAEERKDIVAACELARIYLSRGEIVSAEKWLKISQVGGHAHAACLLGSFYHRQGKMESAEEYWKLAYEGGHLHTSSDLSTMLAAQGRGREAAVWLGRSRKSHGGTRRTRKPSRNRSKRRR
jgi:uncharacterized protein